MMGHSFSFVLRKKMDFLEMLVMETMGVFLMKDSSWCLCVFKETAVLFSAHFCNFKIF